MVTLVRPRWWSREPGMVVFEARNGGLRGQEWWFFRPELVVLGQKWVILGCFRPELMVLRPERVVEGQVVVPGHGGGAGVAVVAPGTPPWSATPCTAPVLHRLPAYKP